MLFTTEKLCWCWYKGKWNSIWDSGGTHTHTFLKLSNKSTEEIYFNASLSLLLDLQKPIHSNVNRLTWHRPSQKKCSTGFYRIKAKIRPFCGRKINLGPKDSFRKISFIVNSKMFKCWTQDWQKLIRISHPKYSGLLESTFTICCHGSKNNRTSCYCGCC